MTPDSVALHGQLPGESEDAFTRRLYREAIVAGNAGHQPKRRVQFDPTINLGHILTFLGFLIAGAGAYSNLDKRVTVVEVEKKAAIEHSIEKDSQVKQSIAELRNDIKDVQRSVNDINRTLAIIAPGKK